MSDEKHEAEIILHQLGGNRFMVMTGAYNFLYSKCLDDCGNVIGTSLQFRFKGSTKSNCLIIDYSHGYDLYRMRFLKIGRSPKFKVSEVEDISEVYAEDLQHIFTGITGLYTSL